MQTMHFLYGVAIQPNLELKTRPKPVLGSLPLAFALPGCISCMHAQAESVGVLKQKVQACSKRSSFSQSVSMRDYYITNIDGVIAVCGNWQLIYPKYFII
jgi:hypothetical protein